MESVKKAFAEILIQVKEEIEDLLKARTLITFAFYGTFLYMILKKMEVPPALNSIVSTLFGYWFGSRNGQNGTKPN